MITELLVISAYVYRRKQRKRSLGQLLASDGQPFTIIATSRNRSTLTALDGLQQKEMCAANLPTSTPAAASTRPATDADV